MIKLEEDIYRLVFENSLQGMVLRQGDRMILANQAYADIVGYTIAELLEFTEQDVLDIIHPEDRKLILGRHRLREVGESVPNRYEYRYIHKSGEIRWVEATVATIDYGDCPAFLGTYINVTERKRAEEALRASEALYRTVVEYAHAGIFIIDEDHRFQYVNDELCTMLGRSGDEILGEDFRKFLDPVCRDEIADRYDRRQRGEDVPNRYEIVILRKHGERRFAELSAAVIYDSEGRVRTVGQVMDMTDRKQAEVDLRRFATELQARNAELDAFAHTVAHDLKNPLTQVIGFAETLQEIYRTLEPQEVSQYLSYIAKSGRSMDATIDALLLLSSVLTVEEVETELLDMAAIVSETLETLAPMVEDYQAEVVLPDAWHVVRGYAPWIKVVWLNYLTNALKYGGEPPRLELGSDVQAGMIRYWVCDNGPGLTEEEQAKLFVPFSRLHESRAKGYGLGLSIVGRILDKLQGNAGVESEPGQGSCFYFALSSDSV